MIIKKKTYINTHTVNYNTYCSFFCKTNLLKLPALCKIYIYIFNEKVKVSVQTSAGKLTYCRMKQLYTIYKVP